MTVTDPLYELVTELLGNVVCRLDRQGVILYASESARHVFGYAPEEMVGRLGAEFIHPDDLPAQRASFYALATSNGERLPPFRSRALRKDGTIVHTETVCRLVYDERGAIVEVNTAAHDITARVEAEAALGRTEASLHALLEALPEPACVHDRGALVHVNRAVLRLLGWDAPADLIGRPVTDFVHPADVDFVRARVAATQTNVRTPEHRLVTRTGDVIPVEVTGVPFLFHGALGSLALIHDLRPRKQVEAQLAAAERLATLGRVAAAVGHEVNNPLTYVLGSLELLRRDISLLVRDRGHVAQLLARVRSAEDGAMRVRDIARDLKELSTAAPETPADPVALAGVLDRAIATAAHEVAPRARIVRDDGPDELPPVVGHDGRLIQVFVNLLVNAAHAMPGAEDSRGEIHVVSRRAGNTVTIEVQDDGTGFPAEDAERLFEPFFTTKGTGTGLGLSIARHIITAMGGTIVAEPRQPRGACFRITLRVARAQPPATALEQQPPTEPISRRPRILFVDDEAMIRDVARAALDPYEVVTAGSGAEAIDLLARGLPFDAIVCDLHMPGLGGADVYEWIVAHRPELAARVAFTTGGAFTDRTRGVLSSAQRPVMDKPFDFDKLTAVVGSIIAR